MRTIKIFFMFLIFLFLLEHSKNMTYFNFPDSLQKQKSKGRASQRSQLFNFTNKTIPFYSRLGLFLSSSSIPILDTDKHSLSKGEFSLVFVSGFKFSLTRIVRTRRRDDRGNAAWRCATDEGWGVCQPDGTREPARTPRHAGSRGATWTPACAGGAGRSRR